MQLPPTILSVDKPKESKKVPVAGNPAKKTENDGSGHKSSIASKSTSQSSFPSEDLTDATPLPDTDISSDSSADEGKLSDDHNEVSMVMVVSMKDDKKNERPKKQRALRPPRSLEVTMFDRLEKMYGPGIKRMLNVQYRCVNTRTFVCFYANDDGPCTQHACQDRFVPLQGHVPR
jgi:DNA polymerase alpha-associated DNA helicase A